MTFSSMSNSDSNNKPTTVSMLSEKWCLFSLSVCHGRFKLTQVWLLEQLQQQPLPDVHASDSMFL